MGAGWWGAMHLTVLGSGGSGNCAVVSTGERLRTNPLLLIA
jgi:phosphoribosyl 1,2-cyclic phosphodiesterase